MNVCPRGVKARATVMVIRDSPRITADKQPPSPFAACQASWRERIHFGRKWRLRSILRSIQ